MSGRTQHKPFRYFKAMNKKLICLLFMTTALVVAGQNFKEGTMLLKKMHDQYSYKPCRSYSFSQKNTHYKNDTVSGHSEWHENIEFPDKFRIVFGSPEDGNRILFRNDSVFRYRKNILLRSGRDSSSLLLILGGMYYRPYNDVLERLKKAGFNINVLSDQTWNGQAVYVMGAKEGDVVSNQIWVEKKNLKVVRILENTGDVQMDMRFESHQPLCKGYIENKVSFRRNGKMEQVEEYFNVVENTPFPEK